jgi:hypothetical protein
MAKYSIEATRTHFYTVEVEANDEMDAISKLDDWLAEDFEDYETNAQWDFDATEVE